MEKVILLGSTGSIGRQTLAVLKKYPDKFRVLGLAANKNTGLLNKQITQFKPQFICIGNQNLIPKIKFGGPIYVGELGLLKIIKKNSTIINALSGMIGVAPSIKAAQLNNKLLVANKESLVIEGKKLKNKIIPIDSELTSVHYLLSKYRAEKIYITCSGGPFWQKSLKDLTRVAVKQALAHPKWKMGAKNSLDSATLINKGLELIACTKLFGKDSQVLIDPTVAAHALIKSVDGKHYAVLATKHDMKIHIEYALLYPEKKFKEAAVKLADFSFTAAGKTKLPGIKIAKAALKSGEKNIKKLCELNEEAMDLFLAKKIPFLGIYRYIKDHLKIKV